MDIKASRKVSERNLDFKRALRAKCDVKKIHAHVHLFVSAYPPDLSKVALLRIPDHVFFVYCNRGWKNRASGHAVFQTAAKQRRDASERVTRLEDHRARR